MVFVIPGRVPTTVRSTREEGKGYCLNCALSTSDLKKDECPNLLTGDSGKTKVSKSKPAIFDVFLLRSRIHLVMITYTILRNMPDSFKKAIQIAAREEFMISEVTASNASSSAITAPPSPGKNPWMTVRKTSQTAKGRHSQASDESKSAASRRNRRHRQRSTCWTCTQVGHFRRDCHSQDGRQCKKTQKVCTPS
ncbi:Retrotransposon Gag-like protein [Trichinella spiralis]|uniref:Retrotransposon Gag-like protein n=1 Tax=Trichinella spiralis TaxID=6334 RepID=A0ABR3KJW0_TRISP